MVALSPFARLFYLGMWNFAFCDRGHLPDDPFGLKLKILPADAVDAVELLDELMQLRRVVRVDIDGRSYLHMPRFADHQKVDPRWRSRCPVCNSDASSKLTGVSESLPEHTGTLPNSAKRGEKRTEKERRETVGKGIVAEIHPDVSRLCSILADLIEANGSKRPNIAKGWLDSARLLLDLDKRPLTEAISLIQWCQASPFWRANIMSMPTFRDKYDTLRLQRTANEVEAPHRPQVPKKVFEAHADELDPQRIDAGHRLLEIAVAEQMSDL